MDYGLVPLWCCSLVLGCVASAGCATAHRALYVVTVPVADLRAQPGTLATPACHEECGAGRHDPLQETQVLYGEQLRLLKIEGAWAFVEAVEQREYNHNQRWQGYPGWILNDSLAPLQQPTQPTAIITAKWATVWRDAQAIEPWFQLPMGAQVVITSTEGGLWKLQLTPPPVSFAEGENRPGGPIAAIGGETGGGVVSGAAAWISRGNVRLLRGLAGLSTLRRRQAILLAAQEFLGDPYFWGGRSPYAGPTSAVATGVDCSGLVNLAYRVAGIDVPRDAHEQYLRARKITDLEPADLLFLSEPDNPKKIVHVMLYAGEGWLIEGPGTGLFVRRIEVTERLGRPIEQLKAGESLDRQTLFFGTYFR